MRAENALYPDVKAKLNEARLFLNLMRHTEATQRILISGYGVDAQFTYLLTAFLAACYSVLASMKEDDIHICATEGLRNSHLAFYVCKSDGSYRIKDIFFSPSPEAYCFTMDIGQSSICDLCATHLDALAGFVKSRFAFCH